MAKIKPIEIIIVFLIIAIVAHLSYIEYVEIGMQGALIFSAKFTGIIFLLLLVNMLIHLLVKNIQKRNLLEREQTLLTIFLVAFGFTFLSKWLGL